MLGFHRWINNHVLHITKSTAGGWAKFWIATALPLIVSSSNTTDSNGANKNDFQRLNRK
jgi:hypothetical protein